MNRKYGYEKKNKYGIRFHILLMYHVIPHMRNANFINKYGDFGIPSISLERLKIETSSLLKLPLNGRGLGHVTHFEIL